MLSVTTYKQKNQFDRIIGSQPKGWFSLLIAKCLK